MRIYTDESRINRSQGRYMAIGGIVCSKEVSKKVRKDINNLKQEFNVTEDFEFHFSDIQNANIEIYKRLVDIFFKYYKQKLNEEKGRYTKIKFREICFEVILIEHEKINHKKFSDGDAELGFFRFYYTLLKNIIDKHYIDKEKIQITIDNITTKNPRIIPNLHTRLQDYLGVKPTPITIMKQDSKAEVLLQLADIILGAVSFNWSDQVNSNSVRASAKRDIVQYIEFQLKRSLSETNYKTRSFNIWKLEMQD
jgi:hypothetical protein